MDEVKVKRCAKSTGDEEFIEFPSKQKTVRVLADKSLIIY